MRLELNFELGQPIFDVEYRKVLISFLKKSLSEANGGIYFDRFYKDTTAKPFAFSVIFDKPNFQKNKITLGSERIKVIFSASDHNKQSMILYSAFIGQKNRALPLAFNNSMVLKSIKEKKTEKIFSNKVIFRTVLGSGLCVRDHNKETNLDKYFTFEDEEFQEKLQTVLVSQASRAGFESSVAQNIRCKPLKCQKTVVKHYGCYIPISMGMFQVEADPQLLQYFYEAGTASRHSSGFGVVELVAQDLF